MTDKAELVAAEEERLQENINEYIQLYLEGDGQVTATMEGFFTLEMLREIVASLEKLNASDG